MFNNILYDKQGLGCAKLRLHNHAKSCDQAAIGRRNICRLRKDIDWSTVEFVETISFNPMNDHFCA